MSSNQNDRSESDSDNIYEVSNRNLFPLKTPKPTDISHLFKLKQTKIKSNVKYKKGNVVSLPNNEIGIIRYIGAISENNPGKWIGIELLTSYNGTTDGSYDHNRYFTCSPQKGIFVRPYDISFSISNEEIISRVSQIVQEQNLKIEELPGKNFNDPPTCLPPLKKGKVVIAQAPTLKIGIIREILSHKEKTMIGIEVFLTSGKNDWGNTSGEFEGVSYFNTKVKNHGIFVEKEKIIQVLSSEDLMEWLFYASHGNYDSLREKNSSISFEPLQRVDTPPNLTENCILVPSISLPHHILQKIEGFCFYEERYLVSLLMLNDPNMRLIYCYSYNIDEYLIDYYLSLLSIDKENAKSRLLIVNCCDPSPIGLTQKLLNRPMLLKRIREYIDLYPASKTWIHFWIKTDAELELSRRLQINMYAPSYDAEFFGTKEGCRQLFRDAHVPHANGTYEAVFSVEDLANDINTLLNNLYIKKFLEENKEQDLNEVNFWNCLPKKLVIKTNAGFSGEGNALLHIDKLRQKYQSISKKTMETNFDKLKNNSDKNTIKIDLYDVILECLPDIEFAANCKWEEYLSWINDMGVIVEVWVDNAASSPSCTGFIHRHFHEVFATHDQVLNGQIYQGCRFPASKEYRLKIQQYTQRIGSLLRRYGALDVFSVDYVCVPPATDTNPNDNEWKAYAIEINLRWGGTTHCTRVLKFLTGGHFDADTGDFYGRDSKPKYYSCSDNIKEKEYIGLTPLDAIEITKGAGLQYDPEAQKGVVLHMLNALSVHGKFGATCVGNSLEEAEKLMRDLKTAFGKQIEKINETKYYNPQWNDQFIKNEEPDTKPVRDFQIDA